MSTALLLAAQIALAPCAIDGVPGPVRCGVHRVWENREARAGRQIELSVIVLDALGKDRRPDLLFVIAGGPGRAALIDESPRCCVARLRQ